MRDSVIFFLEDAIQRYICVRSLSNFIHKSTIIKGGILLIYGQSQRLMSSLALLSVKHCGIHTDFSFAQSL